MTEPLATNDESDAPRAIGDLVTNVGSRIQEIVDSAERVAAEIRSDAEAEAKRYLDERRREADLAVADRVREFAELSQSLASRVESLQREAAALAEALVDAHRRFDADLATPDARPPRPGGDLRAVEEPNPDPAPQPIAYPGTARPDHARQQGILRATQMAVAGTDRTEIEQMLRTEFGIDDASAVVDQLFGAGPA